jgi:hypothetical protein
MGCHGDDTDSFLSDVTDALRLGVCRYKAVTSQQPDALVTVEFGRYKASMEIISATCREKNISLDCLRIRFTVLVQ